MAKPIEAGDKFRVLCNNRTSDSGNPDKVWISAENGDIIEARSETQFWCLTLERDAGEVVQSIASRGARKLQLQRVRRNTKTTAEKLGQGGNRSI